MGWQVGVEDTESRGQRNRERGKRETQRQEGKRQRCTETEGCGDGERFIRTEFLARLGERGQQRQRDRDQTN